MRGRFHHLTQNLSTVCEFATLWGAHAFSVLVSAFCRNELKSPRSRGRARQHATSVRSPDNPSQLLLRSLIERNEFWTEVKRKPIACQFGDLLQCTGLLKQVRCAGNNLQLHFAAHLVARHFV